MALDDAWECVLAEDAVAVDAVPPFANSAMDGYAVRSLDVAEASDTTPVRLRVNVINGSSQDFVPDGIGVTLESGVEEAPQILDPGQRIELTGPQRTLTRGDVAAFDLAFVVADPDDLTVTLVPALAGYDPLVVTAP